MAKVTISDIVNLPAFEEAGDLFYRATGMAISFHDKDYQIVFYPSQERCDLCNLIQSTAKGRERCDLSDKRAAAAAMKTGRPMHYTCHAGLLDVVVPVVVGEEKIGCFYSGQSLLSPPTPIGYQEILSRVGDLGLEPEQLWQAYCKVPQVDSAKLELAIGILSVICNHMVEGKIALRRERELTREQRKLRRAAEQKARLESDLREMEIRLLQTQLHPHFLFNALNLILGQAMDEDAPNTAFLVEELSVLLRNALTSIGSTVTLAEEAAAISAYVEIFRARFEGIVDLEIDIPDALSELMVPALILQPLAENALVHGFPSCEGRFSLRVAAKRIGDYVEIRVSDSGPGISAKALAALNASLNGRNRVKKTTGLVGLNRRLKYYYDKTLPDLRVEQQGNGFTVAISLTV